MPSNRDLFATLSRNVAGLAVTALLAAVSLLVLPAQASPFALSKQVAGETLALLSLTLLWPTLSDGSHWHGVWRESSALRAAFPLVVLAALSVFWSSRPAIAWEAVASLAIGAGCMVFWSRGFSRRTLERLLLLTAALGLILSVVVVGQYYDWLEPVAFEREGDRASLSSLAGATGDLAAYLALPVLVVQAAVTRAASRGQRILTLAVLAILVCGLLLTQTLTAIFAVATASLVFWWRRERWLRVVLLCGGVAVAGFVVLAILPPLQERVEAKGRALVRGDANEVLTGRLDGWRIAVAMLEENPWIGVGWGAYRAEFAPVKLELARRDVSFYPAHLYPTFQNAHNELLEVGAELGALGLLALGWGMLEAFRAARRIPDRDRRALARSGLVAMLLVSFAYFPFRIAVTAFPYVLFLAWAFRAAEDGGGGSSA